MKRILLPATRLLPIALCLSWIAPAGAQDIPVDNPVLEFYAEDPHEEDYLWTAEIHWDRVYDIRDFGGVADGNAVGDGEEVTDNLPAFQAAVEAAYEAGGGVVYFPAGQYYFSDDISLKSGVVVRGDRPVITDAHDENFDPPTKLEFPRYIFDKEANGGEGHPNDMAFKEIKVEDNANASNIGLVWLDVNRAAIKMSADGDGTRNRLVFGIRNNNVAEPQSDIPQLTIELDGQTVDFQKPWQRFSYRFGRNIHVFARENVLVANNRVNDRHWRWALQLDGWETAGNDDFLMEGYVVRDTKKIFGNDADALVALQAEHEPWFSYTNHYAIHVRGGSGTWGAAPWEGQSLFRQGTTVRDNWVYSTMRVGYHLSGWGLKVLNNVKRDLPGKVWWLHPAGKTTVTGAQTLENRGLDVGGSNILIQGNDFAVERHRINNGRYHSTDGEGILVQECCGGTTLDDIFIHDNTVNAYIGIYKMPYTRNIYITGNTLTRNNAGDSATIMVNANKNGTQAPVFNVSVEENTFVHSGDILVTGSSGGGGVSILNNLLNGGDINYPEGISVVAGNTGQSSLNPQPVGDVRDYPLLELEDPSDSGYIVSGSTVSLVARVTGSFLVPQPVSEEELPDITSVRIFANAEEVASFTDGFFNPQTNALIYSTQWVPDNGYYQLAARATPAGYSGPDTSTEWFTVSDVIHFRVGPERDLYTPWAGEHFPGITDPAVSGMMADPDGDGMKNVYEFVFGADPGNPDPHRGPALVKAETMVHFSCRMRNNTGSLEPEILTSPDMRYWLAIPPSQMLMSPDEDGFTRYEVSIPADAAEPQFISVRLQAIE